MPAGLVDYAASKKAVLGLSEGLREELARDGIAVSVVIPGTVATTLPVSTSKLRYGQALIGRTAALAAIGGRHKVLEPRQVGEIILKGVAAGQFYIPTHTTIGPDLKVKNDELLAAIATLPT